MNGRLRGLVLIAALSGLGACGIFGGDKDESLEPAKLLDIETSMEVKRIWSSKVGDEAKFLRVALRPVGDGNRLYVASRDGSVAALNPENGRSIWRRKLKIDLSAGPGVGDDLVAVVAVDGELIVLDAAEGNERWRTYIGGESLARPLIDNGLIIVQTVDNRLRAYAVFDGSERWTIEQSTPPLTMRGNAAPITIGTNVIAGFDNGRVAAVDATSGDLQWESMLAPQTGRSDLDRLADVDGVIAAVGQDLYAAGYQGRVMSLAAESGQVLWAAEVSSYVGVTADWNNVYTVGENGEVVALSRRTGTESWRNDSLLRRDATVPVPFNTAVVVGDFEGYLHFFSNLDGRPVARLRAGKKAVTAPPYVMANRLYVQSDSGTLTAYQVPEPRQPRRAPDIAEDEGA